MDLRRKKPTDHDEMEEAVNENRSESGTGIDANGNASEANENESVNDRMKSNYC
jgi:hypothetical protein